MKKFLFMFLSVFLCLPIEAQEPDLRSADPGNEHGRKAMTAAEVKRQSEQAWREAHENDSVREREMASHAKRESLDSLRREILARRQLNGVLQKRANGLARASELSVLQERLDSIVDVKAGETTVYNYDEQNRLVSKVFSTKNRISTHEYDVNGYLVRLSRHSLYDDTEWYLDSEYKYTYDSNGNETGEEYFAYYRDGSISSSTYKKEYKLDSQGNILQLTEYCYEEPDEWIPKSLEEYTYYPNSLVKSEKAFEYVGAPGDTDAIYEIGNDYKYDQENREIYKFHYEKMGSRYMPLCITQTWSEYDSKNRKVLDKEQKFLDIDYCYAGVPYEGTWWEYEYDSKDRRTMSANYEIDREIWTGYKYQYEYYDNDDVKKRISNHCEFLTSSSSSLWVNKVITTYDSKGNELTSEWYEPIISNEDVLYFLRNSQGFESASTLFDYASLWHLDHSWINTYNDNNEKIAEIYTSYNEYSNTFSYSEYKLGFVYDKSGRLMEKNKYTRDSADSEFELTSWSKYEYDTQGKLILELEQSYHDVYHGGEQTKELIDDYRHEYIYEDNGNIIETVLPYEHYGRVDRIYDSQNNLISESSYSWDYSLEAWYPSSKYEYAYDNQKNQILKIYCVWDSANNDWKNSTKEEHAYDEENNEILSASYTWDNDYWKGKYSKYEYAYDASRNYKLTIRSDWSTSTKNWVYASKSETAYYANGVQSLYTSLTWSSYRQTWLGTIKEYDEQGRLIVYDYTGSWLWPDDRYEYTYEGDNTEYSSYNYYTYTGGVAKLYSYYEKDIDEFGDLHSEKTIRYADEGEIVSSAVSYLYDLNVLGENVISATTYHKVISGTRTVDGITAPINYYYTLVGNNPEELAIFNEAIKGHGYATVKADAQHIIAVNIDNHGYENFPYGLYDLPNIVEISARGNSLADFAYNGTAAEKVVLSLQDQCVASNLEFAATSLLNANPSLIHSTLKANLPPMVQRTFSAHGMSEPCLDENKGYTMTCFRKDSSGKKEDVFTLQVNKDEVLWTPASSDNIFEFESGETLYITNNGISDGVNAGSHCSCIVTFESGDANFDGLINIQDLQSVINYMVGDSNTIFCKNAGDAYHDGTINVQDIVCLVNTLLDAGYYSAPREMRAQRIGTNDSEIIVRGNDLVLVNNTDIAALDIKLAADCQVEWCLPLGMTVAEEGNHIIAYSLNGDVIASGETVIAHVNGWAELDYANLCTKDAALVPCALRGITTSIKGIDNEKNSESIYSVDGRKRTIQGAGVNIRKYGNGTSKKTVHLK